MKKEVNLIIKIKDNQNHTWQGQIEWLDKKEKESFRSALEMIKLIDSAVTSNDEKK